MNLTCLENIRQSNVSGVFLLLRSLLFFLSPLQRYLAFLSIMIGVHSWIRLFLDPSEVSWLALGLVHGAVLWLWLYWIRLWQPYYPKALLAIQLSCHVYWYHLEQKKRDELLSQITTLNRDLTSYPKPIQIEPFHPQMAKVEAIDERLHPLVIHSKVAVFTFAGGQATRLGKGSKATLVLENEAMGAFSLLEYHARYFKGLQDQGFSPHWALLTSPSNHESIQQHFVENHHFGLDSSRVDFICQKDLPLLDDKGHLWLHQKGCFLEGPSGNGCAFTHLYDSGVLSKWQRAGVELITLNLIDNLLGYPFEFSLLEAAVQNPLGYSLAVVEKIDPLEKVGVLARVRLEGENDFRVRIVEYTDLGHELAQETEDDGLVYRYASTGVMALSMETLLVLSFVDPAKKGWHLAQKRYEIAEGKMIEALKRESFIFDLFAHEDVSEPILVCYPRKEFFAPIKSPEDIAKASKAVFDRDFSRLSKCKDYNKVPSYQNLWSFFKWP